MAMRAVSSSRISPTMMTSGSCRRNDRRPLAKVSPALGFTCTWFTPRSWYSTGSSIVMMLRSMLLSWLSIVYSVVVLPQPPLGDVHIRHDLHAGDDRRLDALGRGHDIVQRAVDSEPDSDARIQRFDVDVARPLPEPLEDDEVDELDHRRFLHQPAQGLQPQLLVGVCLDLLDHRLDVLVQGGVLRQDALEPSGGNDDGLDLLSGVAANVV